MESNLITDNPDSDDVKQRSDLIQIEDSKNPAQMIKIEAQKKEGEDFPDLSYHSSVFMKNNIVLFGGKDLSGNRNNVLNIYDLKEKTWSQKELKGEANQIPKPRYLLTANAICSTIYIIGGYRVGKDKNVYKINFDTQKCQIIGEIIEPVASHTADVHNRSIYIFGGVSVKTWKSISMLQKFNLLTNECEEIKPIGYQPEGRYGHKSLITQDHLYVFGGYSSPHYLQDMFSVDLSNNVSTKIGQHGLIPSPRMDFSFFAFEDKLYLFGGYSKPEYCSDFYGFDLKSLIWQTQGTKNQKCLLKRAFHSTVAVKEGSYKLKVYLVGGKGSAFGNNYKNTNVLTISSFRIYWTLHYLESTGIRYLPGLNLVQEIIEMFE